MNDGCCFRQTKRSRGYSRRWSLLGLDRWILGHNLPSIVEEFESGPVAIVNTQPSPHAAMRVVELHLRRPVSAANEDTLNTECSLGVIFVDRFAERFPLGTFGMHQL